MLLDRRAMRRIFMSLIASGLAIMSCVAHAVAVGVFAEEQFGRDAEQLLRAAAGDLRWCGTLYPTLSSAQDAEMSTRAYEDFVFKAGLLDRAEEAFTKLREGPHRTDALRHLLDIYQQEKEWQKAIEVTQLLERATVGISR